jgi:PhnB protein
MVPRMSNVKAVPDGYGTVTPFLNVNGASEAIEFYKKAFGVEERSKMLMPNGMVAHSELQLGTSKIMVADAMMNPPTQASLHIYVDDCDAMWARATAAGCTIVMPIGDMFWGDRYGVVSDPYGNRWAIATHKQDVSDDEIRRRGEEAMKNLPAPKLA